ncbi:MAG TPA: hydroxymethylbilane synthase [Anaerolineaceae bacterium]|nr:hydroxymethylbilane synthase [Anaerolineaceae bacterium]
MKPTRTRTLTLGSRASKLALWQTSAILDQLKAAWPDLFFQVIVLETEGDKKLERPLPEIGGKGVFTAELEAALRSGAIDLAVHSLKDLPVEVSKGLCIGAVSRRGDARDVLISAEGRRLAELSPGSRVGTSSLRRQAQLKAARPDLAILPLRGNVETRIRKALSGEYEAIVLAAAGVERLDLGRQVSETLPFEVMLPAPGQGAMAMECRADDPAVLELLAPVHDMATGDCVAAERSFLAALGAGCSAPVGAYARVAGEEIEITGMVAAVDGSRVVRSSARGRDPQTLGEDLARSVVEQGAGDLLR